MKELQFSTEKGNFILVDDEPNLKKFIPWDLCELVGVVKYMTEEQFSEVIQGEVFEGNLRSNQIRYINYSRRSSSELLYFASAKESFESLINSLCYYLFENPELNGGLCMSLESARKTNDKVFFNPILLKKL